MKKHNIKTKKKTTITKDWLWNCCVCNKKIYNTVCSGYIVHINEENETYECFGCFFKRNSQELIVEIAKRKLLQQIVDERLGRSY
jgi:hypothetical protein